MSRHQAQEYINTCQGVNKVGYCRVVLTKCVERYDLNYTLDGCAIIVIGGGVRVNRK